MEFHATQSDERILAELGARLSRVRVRRRLTQEQLADEAGVSKSTVERVERGVSVSLTHLIRLLRVLGLVGSLERLVPAEAVRPLEVMDRGGPRKRVRHGAEVEEPSDWSWGDES